MRVLEAPRICIGLLMLVVVTRGVLAGDAGFSPIEVELVSDVKAIEPGKAFTVAIHQKMLPGYHTYWRNAGTVGLPTSVEWDLPDGFEAGPLQWPVPRVTQMARYHVWGYEGEALLLTTITAPSSLKPGEVVEVRGDAAWMCCGQRCHPSGGILSLRLPVREKSESDGDWAGAFQRVREEQPRTMPAWRVSGSMRGDVYRVRVEALGEGEGWDPGRLQFFGYDRQVSSDKPQEVRRSGNGFVVTMMQEEYTGIRTNRLRGILVAEKGWGDASGARVMAVDVALERE